MIASIPVGLEAGARVIPVSPVIPLRVRDVALPRMMISTFAPEGTVNALKLEAVKVTVSRFPPVPAPGAKLTRPVCAIPSPCG